MNKFREKVEGTKTFKGLNKVQKSLTLKKTNFDHLKHGVIVAKNIGITKWKEICQYNQRNISIVEELVINEIEVSHAEV